MSFMKSATFTSLTVLAVITVPLLCVALTPKAQTTATAESTPKPLPDGAGKVIMEQNCTSCHSLSVVTTKRATPVEWDSLVRQMVTRGAVLTDQNIITLTQYLSKDFGPGAPQYALPSESASVPTASSSNPAVTITDSAPKSPTNIQVNVNRASVHQLESALSLTRDEAKTLIAYRKQHGDFQNWQQVGEIPGVPAGKIIEYQDRLVF